MQVLLLIMVCAATAMGCFVGGVYLVGGLGPALLAAAPCFLAAALLLRRGMIDG